MSMRIEINEDEEGGYFTVVVNGQFADMLGRDEALGVVAHALFSNVMRAPYLQSYAGWDAWNRRYRVDESKPPIALLADQRVLSTAHTGIRPLFRPSNREAV